MDKLLITIGRAIGSKKTHIVFSKGNALCPLELNENDRAIPYSGGSISESDQSKLKAWLNELANYEVKGE